MPRRLAAALALCALLWLPSVTPPQVIEAASCTAWPSTRVPPSTIRVLRSGTGRVQAVSFKTYVQRVLSVEWPPGWPTAAIQTGAVAVKQYGWYYTMHWRGGTAHGSCYDVIDNTNDQIYRDVTPASAFVAAVDATWDVSLTRNGSFILTGYRSGASVACGLDADGYHLFQHSSYYCATIGMNVDQILNVYFGPGLEVSRASPSPAAIFLLPAIQAQSTVGTTATVAWTEAPAAGTTVTDRLVSLMMAAPRNGSCTVDRWVAASPAWQSTEVSPQTVTGLAPGYCYRLVVRLTDSTGNTTLTQSGTMLVDPSAPTAVFTSPDPHAVTAIAGSTATVRWTETLAPGTTLVSRKLSTERAAEPATGTCAGALWTTISSTSSASPASITGLAKWYCYRFRLDLKDSAGHTGRIYSGELLLPSA